jgi:hypothetical protein
MFARWSQENFFKYMREHYGLDRLVEYAVGPVPAAVSMVNPARRKLDSNILPADGHGGPGSGTCDRPPGLLGWAFRPRNFMKNLVLRAPGRFFVWQVVNMPPIGNRPAGSARKSHQGGIYRQRWFFALVALAPRPVESRGTRAGFRGFLRTSKRLVRGPAADQGVRPTLRLLRRRVLWGHVR